ncbi:MAG TPA: hypothetical protein VH854_15280 [Thermoanaerobaculia bacterium]|jgi:hypothetical protein|nr:hypothetical protein [Thermoanaerobaculia bacterium]
MTAAEPVAPSPSRARTNRIVVAVTVAAAAAILSAQLLVPPVVGLADNGDFDRVMRAVGLDYVGTTRAQNFGNWALVRFRRVPASPASTYTTSEVPLAAVAVALSDRLGSPESFDVRWLGALHALLLVAALGLLASSTRDLTQGLQWLAAALLVFFFTDVGYAAPLNSLYAQVAAFLFLMLAAGITAGGIRRGGARGVRLLAYFAAAALFVTAKPQQAIHGPLLAALGLALAGVAFRRLLTQPAVWLAAGLCALSLWCYLGTPSWLRELALYDTLFREILPHSPDPARDLAELGLDPDLARYAGHSPYPPDSPFHDPAFRARVFPRYGYGAMLRFYLRHPRRAASLLHRASGSAFHLRAVGLGNFPEDSGRPARSQSERFSAWSTARDRLRAGAPAWLALLIGGSVAAAAAGWRGATSRGRLFRLAIAILAAMATVELLVAVLADIIGDLARHLFVFHAMVDLLIAADLVWLAHAAFNRRRAARPSMSAGR